MGAKAVDNPAHRGQSNPRWIALASILLAAVVVAMFADVLRPGTSFVPSSGDVEIHARLLEFAAGEIRKGNLPLWNPHVFSGTPALGNPNAAMLYPLSLLAVVLPIAAAITWSIAIHTLLAAGFMFVWAWRRSLHPLGCLLAAAMAAFGGPFVGRIYPGHVTAVAAMAWTPLLLLVVDELLRRPRSCWLVIGVLGVTMEALGGHPQFVFYSFLAAGMTVALRLREAERPARVLLSVAFVLVGGLGLAAVQLVSVFDALGQAIRGSRLGIQGAADFSMTWSSLVMLLVPDFFGHGTEGSYWGDWLYWEMTPFVGIVGLAMAAYGAAYGPRSQRLFAGTLAIVFVAVALGSNTPLFGFLYESVPPFDRFRASARAVYFAGLFVAMLAGVGVDTLIRERRACGALALPLAACAVALASFAGWIYVSVSRPMVSRIDIEKVLALPAESREQGIQMLAGGDAGRAVELREAAAMRDRTQQVQDPAARRAAWDAYKPAYVAAMAVNSWQRLRAKLVSTQGYSYKLDDWVDPVQGRAQAYSAAGRTLLAALTCALAAMLAYLASRSSAGAVGLAVLGIVEMICFAWSLRESVDLRPSRAPDLEAFYRARPGDYRVHNLSTPNSAMTLGVYDVWGFDSFVLERYAQFMASTQGLESVQELSALRGSHPAYRMLRLQYVLGLENDAVRVLAGPSNMPPPLPRAALVRRYDVSGSPQEVLATIKSPSWNPETTAILEEEPNPAPVDEAAGGTVAVRDESTDALVIDVDTPSAALVLITDAYGRGWRATDLTSSSNQDRYEVLRANAVLRAVPVAAGHHRFRLEFRPAAYAWGVAVSLASLAALAVVGTLGTLRERRL